MTLKTAETWYFRSQAQILTTINKWNPPTYYIYIVKTTPLPIFVSASATNTKSPGKTSSIAIFSDSFPFLLNDFMYLKVRIFCGLCPTNKKTKNKKTQKNPKKREKNWFGASSRAASDILYHKFIRFVKWITHWKMHHRLIQFRLKVFWIFLF